ncbi:hypothetical protein ACEPAG_2623 [Sanghuangporus baumii]
MNHALQLPELFVNYFGPLDANSQRSCALVCKTWSDAALDELWRKLGSPKPLVSLLCRTHPQDQTPYLLGFERPIRASDWKAFYRYASRVRKLHIELGELAISSELSPNVFHEIARKRLSTSLLPNLRRLEVGTDEMANVEDLVHTLLFMGQSVEELSLGLPRTITLESLSIRLSDFFEDCSTPMPQLK